MHVGMWQPYLSPDTVLLQADGRTAIAGIEILRYYLLWSMLWQRSEMEKGLRLNSWASLFQILDVRMSPGSIFSLVYVPMWFLIYISFILQNGSLLSSISVCVLVLGSLRHFPLSLSKIHWMIFTLLSSLAVLIKCSRLSNPLNKSVTHNFTQLLHCKNQWSILFSACFLNMKALGCQRYLGFCRPTCWF